MKRPLIAAGMTILLAGAPALAGSSTSEAFEMKVELNRAALDDASSISTEYDKLKKQISDRCVKENGKFDTLRRYIAVKQCVNTTMDNTVRQIDHADLTRFHTEKR